MLEPTLNLNETGARKFSELPREVLADIAANGVEIIPSDHWHDEDFCKRYAAILLRERSC